jgi:cell division protein FtsW
MLKKYFQFDKTLFIITTLLVVFGLFVFLSASFSTFGDIQKFKSILFNQLVLGLCGGMVLFMISLYIPEEYFKKYALWMYGLGLVLLALVFVPHIGFSHGGAKRWLSLGPLSFQPVEFAKYATVIYISAWLSTLKTRIHSLTEGLIPFGIIIGLVGGLLSHSYLASYGISRPRQKCLP